MSYDEDLLTSARLADAAYGSKPVDGYRVDPELSNNLRTVYVDNDGNATVAFRGTDLKDKRWYDELGTDLLLGLGLQRVSSRFKNSRGTVDKVVSKYGRDKTKLVGHSRGGSTALNVSHQTGLPAVGLNSGVGPVDTLRRRTYNNAKSHRTSNDLVSSLSSKVRGLKTTIVKGRGHGVANFL